MTHSPSSALLTTPDQDEVAESITRALLLAIELRDEATGRHCRQVGELGGELALALGHTEAEARLVTLAGRLHDLGKIGVPDRVLRNSDDLSPRQLEIVRAHAENGERLLLEMGQLSDDLIVIGRMIGAHHERWSGRGYPRGLIGPRIPRGGRILAVADAYSAMTAARSYSPPRDHATALDEIRAGAGAAFDPEIVEAFCSLEWPEQSA